MECHDRARFEAVGKLRCGKRSTVLCDFAAGRLDISAGLFLAASAKRLRSFAAALAIGNLGARCRSSSSLLSLPD